MSMPDDNPLDALEELLKNTKGGATAQSPKDDSPSEKEQAEALEKKRQLYEQKEQAQAVIDQQKLVQQKEAILSLKKTQAYQARVQQDTKKKAELKRKAVASDGFEIEQIDHTKI